MGYTIRAVAVTDKAQIMYLYRQVASTSGGIARGPGEITGAYINRVVSSTLRRGLGLVAIDRRGNLIGEIHAFKPEPSVFQHVFSELTIAVHPDHQGSGVGRQLFKRFLELTEKTRDDILRVELLVRESNKKAISFYLSLGFNIEGQLASRIMNRNGTMEADIPMAWLNKHGKK